MTLGELDLHSFLRLGYFIEYRGQIAPIDFSRIDRSAYREATLGELLGEADAKLMETFAGQWQSGRSNVVPLSGGLDSRLILGALLEHTEACNIDTFTYGVPGAYDYEIGNAIARRFGTRHVPISIGDGVYSLESERIAARRTDCQGVLFHHPPLWMVDRLYPGERFWSGFVGDVVAGSFLYDRPAPTLREAKKRHLARRTFVRSVRLDRIDDDLLLEHMGGGDFDPGILTWDEQLFFAEAAPKFTAPLVLFDGYEFVTPFINTPWMDFMFSVPGRFRLGERLLLEFGARRFPDLFGMPTTHRHGHNRTAPDYRVRTTLWLNRVRKVAHQLVPAISWPNHHYDDFSEGIRTRPDLRDLVWGAISRLRERGLCPWIDYEGIWRRHDLRVRNHSDALLILASLEILLEEKESTSPSAPVRP